MFDLVLRSSRDELRQQLQSIIGNLGATATFKDGLTALSAYMMFVLHYLQNHLTTANLHNWPIISHANLQHLTSRQAFTAAVARPWGDIPGTEVADVVKFLISRFPRPPTIAIGEREIGLLAKELLSSKIPVQHMFLLGAKEYAISEESVHIWEFPVNYFPGLAWSPNRWYLWGHGTTPQGLGLVGILTAMPKTASLGRGPSEAKAPGQLFNAGCTKQSAMQAEGSLAFLADMWRCRHAGVASQGWHFQLLLSEQPRTRAQYPAANLPRHENDS